MRSPGRDAVKSVAIPNGQGFTSTISSGHCQRTADFRRDRRDDPSGGRARNTAGFDSLNKVRLGRIQHRLYTGASMLELEVVATRTVIKNEPVRNGRFRIVRHIVYSEAIEDRVKG